MFIRSLQISRLICTYNRTRFFSTINQPKIEPKNHEILPIQNQLPTIANLPTYLPAPTGVPSKLFDEFYLIYRFRYHQPLRYVQLLKLAQTLATILITPYQIYNYTQGVISLLEMHASIFMLSLASFSLLIFGWAATRTICFMYTTVECDRVILSYVDFWGRRRNLHLDTRDIVPINDIETPNKTILPFKRYSSNEKLYYSIPLGQILDRPRFNRIFAGLITQDTKNWW